MSEVYEALRRSGVVLTGEGYEEKEQAPPAWASVLEDTRHQQDELPIDQAPVLQSSFSAPARLVALSTNGGLGKEKFTVLSTHLKHLQDKNPLKRVIVTSGLKAEGKSLVATNLAISLARNTKQKVLLLEGDMRQPSLERLVGCGEREGLSDWLQASDPRSNYVTRLEGLPLWFLFAGIKRERPMELLQSPRLPQLLALLGNSFDWIVVDAPPLMPLADTSVWLRLADGALMVVRENQTSKKVLQKAMDNLGKTPLLSVVFNDAKNADESYYDAYKTPAGNPGRQVSSQ
jgi:capsular exopolysaccharide synthesis family protein